jgi:hypothetical protein
MSLEALWSIAFESSFGYGGHGVAVFETGRILGGDSIMTYVGSFGVENGQVHGEIRVRKYAPAVVPGMASVVGLDDFNLKITGKADPQKMILSGFVIEDPSRTIRIEAVRRAELP